MSAVLNNAARISDLDVVLAARAGNLSLRLFQNNFTVIASVVPGSFTIATFSGYASATPTWGSAALDGNGNGLAGASTETFTHNGGGTSNTIYGWYLLDTNLNEIAFAENFPAPVVMSANGQFISVTPNWYFGQIPAPY